MKKILVPIDFSENAVNALHYAVAYAQETHAKITLFNSYPIDVPMGIEFSSGIYMRTLNAEVKFDHETRLREIADEFKKTCYRFSDEPVAFDIVVKEGTATESIVSMAEEHQYDLIIMGTQGASGLEEVFLGSITAFVIDRVKVPVLAIPQLARFSGLKKVVYATDFHENDPAALKTLQTFTEGFEAEITCIHINTEFAAVGADKEKLEQIRQLIPSKNTTPVSYEVVHGKRVEQTLHTYLEEQQVDLVAVLPKERGFFENLFHKSITRKMAFHSKIPIFVPKCI
jgi:nucleotide-binding universal stress UspA family protein